MQISDIQVEGYQRVVKAEDPKSGLRAIISVHNTKLGPALGGMRLWAYESEQDALTDALRLSKGMTYKSAVAQTGLGGGKSVIIGDRTMKSEELFLAMGEFVDSLGGLYITAEDVNTTVPDMQVVRRATKHVTGLSRADGGSGNPSPYTAYGVFLGLKAAVEWKFEDDDLSKRSVAVQGVGATGSELCRRLREAGATVYAADRNEERVAELAKEFGVIPADAATIVEAEVDVFAPCALGAVVNDDTVGKLRCKVIAGSANNILHKEHNGAQLYERGITYAPDYVINAGGIVNVSVEFLDGGYDQDVALQRIERIPKALREIWVIAREDKISSSAAADRLAESILAGTADV